MKYGFFVNGPFLHFLYSKLYVRFENNTFGTIKKMLLSQSIVSYSSILIFYSIVPLIQGKTVGDSIEEIKNKSWQTMQMNWRLWPLVQLVNFTLVPTKLQVLWVNMFGLIFNVYLSFMTFVYKPKLN